MDNVAQLLIDTFQRFLLPRIAQSHMARHSLKVHHLNLLRHLTTSLSSFKESQAEAWSILPKTDPWGEPPGYSKYSSVDDVLCSFGEKEVQYDTIPPVTLLRCGMADLAKGQDNEQNPTTEELYRYLEEKIPWLASTDGLKYQVRFNSKFVKCTLPVLTTSVATALGSTFLMSPLRGQSSFNSAFDKTRTSVTLTLELLTSPSPRSLSSN